MLLGVPIASRLIRAHSGPVNGLGACVVHGVLPRVRAGVRAQHKLWVGVKPKETGGVQQPKRWTLNGPPALQQFIKPRLKL